MEAEKGGEPRVERDRAFVQRVLRVGLVVSLALMMSGFVLHLVRGGDAQAAVPLFEIARPRDLATELMALGILTLALTPAVRVLSLVVLWARERDVRFVLVGISVVLTLGLALVLAHG